MKRLITIFLLILVSLFIGAESSYAQEYRLSAGDVLNIEVLSYQELQSKEMVVRPDGKLAFPLVGELEVMGKTPAEVTEALTDSLSRYIIKPQVTVNVIRFHTIRVYVLGEVLRPGPYDMDKQHSVLDAVAMAGGYTKDAAKKKAEIIRRDNTGQPLVINMLDMIRKGDLSQNYILNEGDVVYLNDNGRIDFIRDILPWVSGAYLIHQFNK
ncbi:MAG: polysaccharide export protein [Anaerolineaceae bacterium]|nr:polysaccharide export protein [Anaerolineaceae bacterium]